MSENNSSIGIAVLVGAIVLACGFGGYKYHQGQMGLAIQAGQQSAIVEIIKRTEGEACQAVNLFAGENKVDLISVACVKPDGFIAPPAPVAEPEGEPVAEETTE